MRPTKSAGRYYLSFKILRIWTSKLCGRTRILTQIDRVRLLFPQLFSKHFPWQLLPPAAQMVLKGVTRSVFHERAIPLIMIPEIFGIGVFVAACNRKSQLSAIFLSFYTLQQSGGSRHQAVKSYIL